MTEFQNQRRFVLGPGKMMLYAIARLMLWALFPYRVAPRTFQTYYSRPDINAPILNVSLHTSEVNAGKIFITPFFHAPASPDSGPYIFDNSGVLVWSGVDDSVGAGQTDIQGLHVCCYQDENHLCFWQGRQRRLHGSGIGVIMNKNYQVVKTVQSTDSNPSAFDLHEFRLTSEGTALVTAYQARLYDSVWILDSMFQEISLNDSRVLFEWSSLDHVDPSESVTPRGTYPLLGNGLRNDHSWDYFHINSIDKNDFGDYLISSRHTDCIYKISRVDGSILWRLHGDHSSSYHLTDFTFRRQHDVRFQEETENRTVISLFNNDNDRYIAKGLASTGMIVEINHVSKAAHKLAEFKGPKMGGLVTAGSGSMSLLSDGKILVGWGSDSSMAEYLPDGTPIWYAHIGLGAWNYRANKGNWSAIPLQRPALWTYALSPASPIHLYVSWNGATEVKFWRFYASEFEDGPYRLLASETKEDFETMYSHSVFQPWTIVEAVGQNGNRMRNSSIVKTVITKINATEEDCKLQHCILDDDIPSSSSSGHVWDKTVDGKSMEAFSQLSACLDRSIWQYLEHLMAVVGAVACLAIGIFVSGFHIRLPKQQYRMIG